MNNDMNKKCAILYISITNTLNIRCIHSNDITTFSCTHFHTCTFWHLYFSVHVIWGMLLLLSYGRLPFSVMTIIWCPLWYILSKFDLRSNIHICVSIDSFIGKYCNHAIFRFLHYVDPCFVGFQVIAFCVVFFPVNLYMLHHSASVDSSN